MEIAVIGSGLSAIGAIKALVKCGIRPVVLDVGDILEKEKQDFIDELKKIEPTKWSNKDREILSKNDTVKNSSNIPKKLLFGSDYFYGKSIEQAKVINEGILPPFSYAKGGLSVGWGAAILPPSKYDLEDWPIDEDEFHKYCKLVLQDLKYSSEDDGLSLNFPRLKKSDKLKLSKRTEKILNSLKKKVKLKKDSTLYGEGRLLVDAKNCKYCGECMSGCVYDVIYKSSNDMEKLQRENQIEYISNILVNELIEKNNRVIVECFDIANNEKKYFEFDKVFVATGALNTSKIILNSLKRYNKKLNLKTRGGFVIPVFSIKPLPIDWPNVNTQPSLFIEFRGDGLKHWVHTQVASDNELLLKMLGIKNNSNDFISKIKRLLARHLYLLLVNYHSDHSGTYELELKKENDETILYTKHNKAYPQLKVLLVSWWKLFKILFKIGSLPLFMFAKLNSGSYHVGGTLPMKENPNDLESDLLGRVKGLENIHIVDTTIFPSLPGTTIGLMMMANAYRIVDKIFNKDKVNAENS